MEEILQDINEFPNFKLKFNIVVTLFYLIFTYIGYRKTRTWCKDWQLATGFFIIFCLFFASYLFGMKGISKENFESLAKLEGTLQYNDNEGLYLLFTETIPEKKNKLKLNLLDEEKNLLHFKNEFVGIWIDSEFAYQLEHNGEVIYSLEQINEKVLGTKKTFKSLHKIEGILHYSDDEGFYMIEPPQVEEKHFYLLVELLDTVDNVCKYENQPVTIWQKNHVAYQLEYNGEVIYNLERSNSKVWLAVIYDLSGYILFFSVILAHFIIFIREE